MKTIAKHKHWGVEITIHQLAHGGIIVETMDTLYDRVDDAMRAIDAMFARADASEGKDE